MVSVKVCWRQNGKPAENFKVMLGFDNWTHSNDEYTNSSGEAHFDVDPGHGKVYVDGGIAYEGNLQGKIVVYVS